MKDFLPKEIVLGKKIRSFKGSLCHMIPSPFVKMMGTGIVIPPAHAPFDYCALKNT